MNAHAQPHPKPPLREGQIILKWWVDAMGDRSASSAKALSARLRRANGVEALAELAVHQLAQRLGLKPTPYDTQRLLRMVQVLAWVREHDVRKLAERLGPGGDQPLMSALRFQSLMRAEGDELIVALRRAVTLAKFRCNVAALGEDLLRWDDHTRRNWSFQYFGAALRTPKPIHLTWSRAPHEHIRPIPPADTLPAIQPQPR